MDIIDNLSAVSDSELVSQARDGDRRAFDELFGRYQESIRQMYLQRTGGNEPDSNDMLQNTFPNTHFVSGFLPLRAIRSLTTHAENVNLWCR